MFFLVLATYVEPFKYREKQIYQTSRQNIPAKTTWQCNQGYKHIKHRIGSVLTSLCSIYPYFCVTEWDNVKAAGYTKLGWLTVVCVIDTIHTDLFYSRPYHKLLIGKITQFRILCAFCNICLQYTMHSTAHVEMHIYGAHNMCDACYTVQNNINACTI